MSWNEFAAKYLKNIEKKEYGSSSKASKSKIDDIFLNTKKETDDFQKRDIDSFFKITLGNKLMQNNIQSILFMCKNESFGDKFDLLSDTNSLKTKIDVLSKFIKSYCNKLNKKREQKKSANLSFNYVKHPFLDLKPKTEPL